MQRTAQVALRARVALAGQAVRPAVTGSIQRLLRAMEDLQVPVDVVEQGGLAALVVKVEPVAAAAVARSKSLDQPWMLTLHSSLPRVVQAQVETTAVRVDCCWVRTRQSRALTPQPTRGRKPLPARSA